MVICDAVHGVFALFLALLLVAILGSPHGSCGFHEGYSHLVSSNAACGRWFFALFPLGFGHFGFPFCMAVAREVPSLSDPASKLSGHKEVHPGQIVQSYINLPQTHLAMLLLR